MLIYTNGVSSDRLKPCSDRGLGFMISTTTSVKTDKAWKKFQCALDNGAFSCWQRGFPFQEKAFYKQLESCYKNGISLNFIVVPDIVAGGNRSLDFSMEWINGKLRTAPRLALVVQDGMTTESVMRTVGGFEYYPNITHIFVGGNKGWKLKTVSSWCFFAKQNGLKIHVGQFGTEENIRLAIKLGVDSIDSTNFGRNMNFTPIDNVFNRKEQPRKLFQEQPCPTHCRTNQHKPNLTA